VRRSAGALFAAGPASRTSYLAGEIGQGDFWFLPIKLPVASGQTRSAAQLPVSTMITGYARWALAPPAAVAVAGGFVGSDLTVVSTSAVGVFRRLRAGCGAGSARDP
jgi:hypothetical protein